MKRGLVLSLVVTLALAGTVLADVRMGDTELNFSGSFWDLNAGTRGGLDFQSWMVTGGLGYFITDNIEVGGAGLFKETEEKWNMPNTESRMVERIANLYAVGPQIKYHFTPENQLVPYIGAQILWTDLKIEENYTPSSGNSSWERDKQGILWGPLAGLKYTLNEQNELIVEYQYHVFTQNIDDYLDDGHVITVGLGHKFK